jgi:hypothetical protein
LPYLIVDVVIPALIINSNYPEDRAILAYFCAFDQPICDDWDKALAERHPFLRCREIVSQSVIAGLVRQHLSDLFSIATLDSLVSLNCLFIVVRKDKGSRGETQIKGATGQPHIVTIQGCRPT